MFAQCQNCSKEQGLQRAPSTKATRLQTYLASGQLKKRCITDSCSWQKLHRWSPCHFLFAMLSLVRIASCWPNHMNTLILRGTLAFHICLFGAVTWLLQRNLYTDLTEKIPDFSRTHTGESVSLDKATADSKSLCLRN